MATFEAIMKKFLDYYESQTEDVFAKEFMTLKSLSQKYKESNRYPADAGQLQVNRKKNRFKDILPFEYTRVELHPVEGVEGSDYINANYILGSDGEIDYIAAQGPLPHTVEDFWRMLWYHNIEVVVMACREVEMGKNKCERYWPLVRQSMEIGAITVTTTFEENISNDFVIRDFTAECQGEKQTLRQYHYNAWPDHGKPDSPDPIIRMIELINDYRKQKDVPVVVHCSAGCGRTGTLISIDIAKKMLLSREVSSDFSVYKIVEKMRQQRPAMVQAKDQYIFVYMAIAELARRSIGFNPTLPPKPAPKAAPAPTGKSYMNVDTSAPTASSRSPSPSSTSPPGTTPVSSSSAQDTTSEQHLYENVNTHHPPPPSHPPPHHHKGDSASNASEELTTSVETVQGKKGKISPPIGNRPAVSKRPQPKNRPVTPNTSGSSVSPPPSEKKPGEDEKPGGPMPKPRPRGKKGAEGGSNASSISPPRNGNGGGGSAGPPPPMPKINPPSILTRSASPSTATSDAKAGASLGAKNLSNVLTGGSVPRPKSPDMSKRPLPSTPNPRSHSPSPKSATTSASSSPVKSLSPERHNPSSKPTPSVVVDADAMYSLVGPGVDVGPEIMVVDEKSNKAVPLEAVSRTGGMSPVPKGSSNSKSSIMDTFKDILGEELLSSVEKKSSKSDSNVISSRPLPSVPPGRKGTGDNTTGLSDSLEDAPPEIPQRTDARLELVDFQPVPTPFVASPTYDIPGAITTTDGEVVGGAAGKKVSTHQPGYEQPTPFSKNVGKSGGGKGPPPAKPSPANTLPVPGSKLSKGKLGMFSIKKKSKNDHKKSGTEEKPKEKLAINSVTSSSVSLPPQSSLSLSSGVVEDKYRFPGSLGYGIRLERPTGPREEPHHWKTVMPPTAIHVT